MCHRHRGLRGGEWTGHSVKASPIGESVTDYCAAGGASCNFTNASTPACHKVVFPLWSLEIGRCTDACIGRTLRTGDIAEIDEHGFIYIVDRIKDIVIRGGENISCSEVENAFYRHRSVLECTAVGVPDTRLGEDIAVMLYLHPGTSATAQELIAAVSKNLAGFKTPKSHHVYFSAEPLPRGATGKILKAQVRTDIAKRTKAPAAKL